MFKQLVALSFFLIAHYAQAQITKDQLAEIAHAVHLEYDQELFLQNAQLEINPTKPPQDPDFWWNLPTVRASYATYVDPQNQKRTHYIYLMGGYARLPGISFDGFVATICHEIGHGIGGAPYKIMPGEKNKISVEGQADDFAYRSCVPRLFKRLAARDFIKPVNSFTEKICRSQINYDFCTRVFQTLESERNYFQKTENVATDYHKPDLSKVTQVNTAPDFYPSPQCRLDTMMNAAFGKQRPRCWFVP